MASAASSSKSRTRRAAATAASREEPAAQSGDDAAAPDFETAMGDLDAIVEQLEGGELSLSDALDRYTRGMRLARRCEAALDAAERRVEMLSHDDADAELTPFDDSEPPRGG